MRLFTTPVAQPTSAERIRSILMAADSMTIVTDEGRTEVSRLHGPGATEHIHLHPRRTPAMPAVRTAPRTDTRAPRWSSPTSHPPPCATGSAPVSSWRDGC